MTIKTIGISIICALVTSAVLGYVDFLQNKFYFVVEMRVSTVGVSWVLFNNGRAFAEQNIPVQEVEPGIWRSYSFVLPRSRIDSIRFDPIDSEAVIELRSAQIENSRGDSVKLFPAQSFISGSHQQIDEMEIIDDLLVIRTTVDATDPIIVLNDSSFEPKTFWPAFFAKYAWSHTIYLLPVFMFFLGSAKYLRPSILRIFKRSRVYSARNPVKTIALIGVIAAIASCYPVVFLGKSFSSIGVGMWGLYSQSPWFPGLPVNAVAENFRGSDTYAAAVSFFPNTAVQYASLFLDFEFPFWNRYVGGGVPLFGQSQSMIGDPLHWIPVAMGGSALGWDIKIVLSKAVFSVGMGLLVKRLTNNLSAALLITISSCFLGFFAWRFNHPALFVISYAPWLVLQWDRLGAIFSSPTPRLRSWVYQAFLLVIVSWLQFNAGATKEGVISAAFMHAFGVSAFLTHVSPKWGLVRSISVAAGIGAGLILIAAPYWLIFLDTLAKSYTNYDDPRVITYPIWALIGFFDNLFYQRAAGQLWGPSVNLFILFGMASAALGVCNRQPLMFYTAWGLFALAMCTAFGLIPDSFVVTVPFIRNIVGVGNTFAVPMTLISLVIAGYGVKEFLTASPKRKINILAFTVFVILVLWLVNIWPSFELAYPSISVIVEERHLVILAIILVLLLPVLLNKDVGLINNKYVLAILFVAFVAVHIRHGLHPFTGVQGIDRFVTNPTERPDYSEKSTAIEFLKIRIGDEREPTRVIGESVTLFPGTNTRLGLESLVTAEAIRSKHFQDLLNLVEYPYVGGGWLYLIKSDEMADRAAALDLLGVGYVVADVGVQLPSDMKLVHSSDLSVWQRDSVWPRAFFVNSVVEVSEPADILAALASNPHRPFAAVESRFMPSQYSDTQLPYKVVVGRDYRLTNNSTGFLVDASGPGMIVLGETYYRGDFVAEVNGERVDYIPVNGSSKGIWVNAAGLYDVSFRYRPEKLSFALSLSFSGLVLLILLIKALHFASSNSNAPDRPPKIPGTVN